jgi:hypothetical protein
MINQSVLFQSKAYLCWDRFPDLEIKLIPLQSAVAFFYPPNKKFPVIHLYFNYGTKDFTDTLCLLFHEVGHYLQWDKKLLSDTELGFFELINKDKGEDKIYFESQAWDYGQEYLEMFLKKEKINKKQVLERFKKLKNKSIKTYSDKMEK